VIQAWVVNSLYFQGMKCRCLGVPLEIWCESSPRAPLLLLRLDKPPADLSRARAPRAGHVSEGCSLVAEKPAQEEPDDALSRGILDPQRRDVGLTLDAACLGRLHQRNCVKHMVK